MKKILLFSLFVGLVACADTTQENGATSGDEDVKRAAEALGAEENEQNADKELAGDERARDEELAEERGGCAPTGCSGQICAEAGSEMMSTCEFRPEYACYKASLCERQPDGNCGWTDSEELRECLANAGSARAILE